MRSLISAVAFIICCLLSLQAFSQEFIFPSGAQAQGLAGCIVLTDHFAAESLSPLALQNVTSLSVSTTVENKYLLPELMSRSVVLATPLTRGSIACSFSRFGGEHYSNNLLSVSICKPLTEKVEAGISLKYISEDFSDNYEGTSASVGALAMSFPLSANISGAFQIVNPFNVFASGNGDLRKFRKIMSAISYDGTTCRVSAAYNAKAHDKGEAIFAFHYVPHPRIEFNAGVTSAAHLFCFGTGLYLGQFRLDIASSYHSRLGYSPVITLSWNKKAVQP